MPDGGPQCTTESGGQLGSQDRGALALVGEHRLSEFTSVGASGHGRDENGAVMFHERGSMLLGAGWRRCGGTQGADAGRTQDVIGCAAYCALVGDDEGEQGREACRDHPPDARPSSRPADVAGG